MRRSGAEQLAQQPSTSNARATHAADASFAWLVSALAAFMAFWVLVLPGSWRVGLVPGLEQKYYEACVHAPTPVPSDVLVRFAVRLWESGATVVGRQPAGHRVCGQLASGRLSSLAACVGHGAWLLKPGGPQVAPNS